MSPKGWTRVILMPLGAIIGAVVGHLITPTVAGIIIGAVSGAAIILLFTSTGFWELFSGIIELLDCCSSSTVLFLTSIVILSGFFLWHSFLLAALAGIGVMTMLLVVLAIVASF